MFLRALHTIFRFSNKFSVVNKLRNVNKKNLLLQAKSRKFITKFLFHNNGEHPHLIISIFLSKANYSGLIHVYSLSRGFPRKKMHDGLFFFVNLRELVLTALSLLKVQGKTSLLSWLRMKARLLKYARARPVDRRWVRLMEVVVNVDLVRVLVHRLIFSCHLDLKKKRNLKPTSKCSKTQTFWLQGINNVRNLLETYDMYWGQNIQNLKESSFIFCGKKLPSLK